MLRDIFKSIVALFSLFSVDSLSKLLVTSKQRVDRMLKDLYIILNISTNTHSLYLHYSLFRDFLLNKNRRGDLDF
jgi:hypothetical protein